MQNVPIHPTDHRFIELLGMEVVREPGRVVTAIDVDERHRQGNRVVHGSVLHALLDTVMGIEAYFAAERHSVATAEISVRFLEPVFDGRLCATARVLKAGKRLVIVEGEVHRGDALVAVAQGSFALIRRPEATK